MNENIPSNVNQICNGVLFIQTIIDPSAIEEFTGSDLPQDEIPPVQSTVQVRIRSLYLILKSQLTYIVVHTLTL